MRYFLLDTVPRLLLQSENNHRGRAGTGRGGDTMKKKAAKKKKK
jgi:hypothetical protein